MGLFGNENCQMLMSVVRVEVLDIRLNLFCLRTFLGFFCYIYILPLFYKGISTLHPVKYHTLGFEVSPFFRMCLVKILPNMWVTIEST